MSSKRSLEYEQQTPAAQQVSAEKKGKVESDEEHSVDIAPDSKEDVQEVRVLIENLQVGGIIGKGGSNVRRVREETGTFVSILKAEFRNVQERVMVLKGTPSQLSQCAFKLGLLMQDAARDKKKPDTPAPEVSFQLLVHKTAVGAIIGKGGQTIKETQAATGTRMQISNEPLPQSTEKAVNITGQPQDLQKAVLKVLQQLAANPMKPTKNYPYVPGQAHFPGAPAASYPGPVIFATAPGGYPTAVLAAPGPPQSTQKIAIPTVCAGCIIGKGGVVIRDLRAQSGTSISIADPDPASPQDRVVTLTGTPQGIQTAVYLIRQLVEGFTPPQPQSRK